jgi:hypothetical protein
MRATQRFGVMGARGGVQFFRSPLLVSVSSGVGGGAPVPRFARAGTVPLVSSMCSSSVSASVSGNSLGGLSRQYLHKLIKRFAAEAGLHVGMVHCHNLRHSTAMRIMERTQRIGAVSGYLCHTDPSAAYTYVKENDGSYADKAMAAVFAEG